MTMKQVADYELEGWIRSYKLAAGNGRECDQRMTWQQRVQYAIGHTINDYFTLSPAFRLHTSIQILLNRRWPRELSGFSDLTHYWEVYNRMVENLTLVTGMMIYDYPVALYENWTTEATELDMRLSLIVQAVWQEHGNPLQMKVQKFLVEEDEGIVDAFVHMVNVFWHSAFGRPPGEIEVYALMEGRRHSFTGESLSLSKSSDYVRLLVDTWEREARRRGGEDQQSAGCPGTCGLWLLGYS
ncbi:hypothetical protein J41TS12_32520 [Paenibacillus antibioticophila]|uniref:Uncharacterized protein n=1 Tax=Paenibacillus antibioticophila TaxID=1274374 RepID=A0A919XSC9_9BACL|nr:hypothetical protein [Paenibacillus antibioticophila]GIO38391.1 hypothetical protein J41TS12_32520 [Paenibacillus antibioticophila]